ncbi:MAG: DNA mismatch repair protein MutS [Patescibacteria group bacterium]|nr:DNA mismatch repair protein MutS [Patescibacteria group bacterium]
MTQDFTTPMMKQYEEIKQQYKDCIVFYRLGDFYETFLDDAYTTSKILNITLTSRTRGKDGRIPMAGVPYHAADSYIAKLVKAGYKVAICEQVSEPDKKGLIERDVVRIVTSGTVLDENALEKKENNFIVSVVFESQSIAIAAADISTGEFFILEREGKISEIIRDEFEKINPSECVISEQNYNTPNILKLLKNEHYCNITGFKGWETFTHTGEQFLKDHFKVHSLEVFAMEGKKNCIEASAGLLGYLYTTQKNSVQHITAIRVFHDDSSLLMDKSTIMNLELFTTIRTREIHGTFVDILDETQTAMGGRMLRLWIRKPSSDKKTILQRHEIVETFLGNRELRSKIRDLLSHVADVERILSRLSVGVGNARDLIHLKSSLSTMMKIKDCLEQCGDSLLKQISLSIHPSLQQIIEILEQRIVDDPPISIKDGGIIKPHVDKTLDMLRDQVGGGKNWIAKLEKEEKEKTGIASLKIRYNKIFGFYIEVSRANMHLVPSYYIRKQTLVNGERFITPELKKYEEMILSAEEQIKTIEYELFQKIVKEILGSMHIIQSACKSIAIIDCLSNFAYIAELYHYCRPTIGDFQEITIAQGRHPVVERLLSDKQFVPNDVLIDPKSQQLLIITGPNMAGKSVFIRQVALIVLMAHIGSFVPAKEARIGIVDRIFVRSGAADAIASGLSTFMVEMIETAYILHHATNKSLIIMDEIGRGTSTYDGISIAWAIAEYLVTEMNKQAKTLFATHYHELHQLETQYPQKIKNFHMAVIEEHGEPVFLYTLLPGAAPASFGIVVAKTAGLPQSVIHNAQKLIKTYDHLSDQKKSSIKTQNLSSELEHKILSFDLSRMTPLQAMNELAALQEHVQYENHSKTS